MNTNAHLQFAQRYHTALRDDLRRSPRQPSAARSERALGREAADLGLNVLDLVRIHDRSVTALASAHLPGAGRRGNHDLSPAADFLLGVIPSDLADNRIGSDGLRPTDRLTKALHASAVLLAKTRKQLRKETTQRKISEQKRVQVEEHYNLLLAQSVRLQEQSRELAHQVLSAQEEERKEISRELHDEVAQILAGINVQLATLKQASEIGSRSLRQRIGQTQRMVERSVQIVHRYARELRPALLDDLGLLPALRSYIRDLPGRRGLPIRLRAYAGVESLDNVRRTVLYRIAQEALTNIARHAHANSATVHITRTATGVRLEVKDDGRSFPVARMLATNTRKRLGLLGMRERVEMVGGVFSIESAPGRGTTVRAEVPLHGSTSGGKK